MPPPPYFFQKSPIHLKITDFWPNDEDLKKKQTLICLVTFYIWSDIIMFFFLPNKARGSLSKTVTDAIIYKFLILLQSTFCVHVKKVNPHTFRFSISGMEGSF